VERLHRLPITRRAFLFDSLVFAASARFGALFARREEDVGGAADDAIHWLQAGGNAFGLDDAGALIHLSREGGTALVLPGGGGLAVTDVAAGRSYRATGRATRVGDGLQQRTNLRGAGLAVSVAYTCLGDGALQVEGRVSDLTGRDRAVDLVYSLPLALSGAAWESSTIQRTALSPHTRDLAQTSLPIAALTFRRARLCVAFSIPPGSPSDFEIGVRPGADEFYLRLRFGLSSVGREPLRSAAPFRFVLDLLPGGWGLRAALDRYYRRHPDYFESRVVRQGYWQLAQLSAYPLPHLYAFHETGKTMGDATTVEEFAENDGWSQDHAAGGYTIAYTNPSQGAIPNLARIPQSYAETLKLLDIWELPPRPLAAPGLQPPNSYRSAVEHLAIIRSSGLHDARGRLRTYERDDSRVGKSVVFPLNPNPRLHEVTGKPTIGAYMLEYYVPLMLSSPFIDGVYVDSLYLWGGYNNFRREHFSAATIPLTYHAGSGRPALSNSSSQLEYLWELRRRLHSAGKILMGNGVYSNQPFIVFALDVIGAEREFETLLSDESLLAFYRAAAHRKPVLQMVYTGWNDERSVAAMWKWALLYCLFVCSGPLEGLYVVSPIEVQYQRRYAPILLRLANAGWQPITGVRVADVAVRVERYGDEHGIYLVVYNTARAATVVELVVDEEAPLWAGDAQVDDLLTGRPIRLHSRRLALAADELRVLHIRPQMSLTQRGGAGSKRE